MARVDLMDPKVEVEVEVGERKVGRVSSRDVVSK